MEGGYGSLRHIEKMSNLEIYNEAFKNIFNVEEAALTEEFCAGKVTNWDSITQMALVSELEEKFDIMFDIDDIIEFSSYCIGKQLLEKYNVVI